MTRRILFGVQGTGNGHISRARKLAEHLRRRGADVTFLFSGRAPERLFDMAVFGDFWHREGLTFATRNGGIDIAATLTRNRPDRFWRDVRSLPVTDFDLVITDFEPVTAWAARRRGIPCLGIGHQYAFQHPVPLAGDRWHSRLIMRHFAPATTAVGLHWHPFGAPILPPIIDTGLQRQPCAGHILVYLPFEEQAAVTRLLNQFPAHRFIQYSPDVREGEDGNVALRQTSLQGFRHNLASARAVLCNAGFELVSECLHLGLPVLVKPLRGQMEQASNALALRRLGWGQCCTRLDAAALAPWIAAPTMPPAIRYPDVARHLVDWLLDSPDTPPATLSATLWRGIGVTANVTIG